MTFCLYDQIGVGYMDHRRPDPRIAMRIEAAVGDAATVVNVGAGTGSYESASRWTVAVEPSREMIRQRRRPTAMIVRSDAAMLPLVSGSFDAAMALVTVHHWCDPRAGLRELHRVADRVVVLAFDPPVHNDFWLFRDYVPEVLDLPSVKNALGVGEIAAAIDADSIDIVPVPFDCADGFGCAYWRRPRRYLDVSVRRAISALSQLPPQVVAPAVEQLRKDIETRRWHQRNAELLHATEFDGGLRLIVRSGT